MKTELRQISIKELTNFFPDSLVEQDSNLETSLNKVSLVSPLTVCQNLVIDGEKRLNYLRANNSAEVNCLCIEGNPAEILIELKEVKSFPMEKIAWLYLKLDASGKDRLLDKAGISQSPQMAYIINHIGNLITNKELSKPSGIPINVWRELGHLGEKVDLYLKDLISMEGTVSEKRIIANLLKSCKLRDNLPEKLPEGDAKKSIAFLESMANPRKTETNKNLEAVLSSLNLPKGVNLKLDPTLEKPGVEVSLRLKRNKLSVLTDLQSELEKLFAKVPEL